MSTSPRSSPPASSTRERLLGILREHPGAVFTADIADRTGLRPSGIRAHLRRLERAGLVRRTRVSHGRGRPRDAWSVDGPGDRAPGADAPPLAAARTPTRADYDRLADLREGLRDYLSWAEERARAHGTTPVQFQLMLAVRASSEPDGPTVTALAEALRLKHHSVVGLVDRAEGAGLVRRGRDRENASRVRVALTGDGERRLAALAAEHVLELTRVAPAMREVWGAFAPAPSGAPRD